MNKFFSSVAPALLLAGLFPIGAVAMDGNHDHGPGRSHRVTTTSAEAQRLFDRGLGLAWGFNHVEAARAFRDAAQEDPQCAMCWWGVALVLGPNINAPMDPQYFPEIREALDRAIELAPAATEQERALILALQQRYGTEPLDDRAELDRAYARAMRRVALRYPDDLDAATLFAEAVMDTMPWDYWTQDREPKPATQEFLDVLESVLRRDPEHSGANHLLIHAVEQTRPDLGVAAAERLQAGAQATGHLVHMASHIFIRVGRYDDAARVNEMAIADDDAYARTHEVPLEYAPYMLHNHHMRWAALNFAGRAEESMEEARYLAANADPEAMGHPVFGGFLQHVTMMPIFDHLRFGRHEAVLATPEPPADRLYPRAVWHFARGVVFAREGAGSAAQTELDRLRAIAADPGLAEVAVWSNPTQSLLAIGTGILTGEVAAARGDWEAAEASLRGAVASEDALVYDEPPPWLPPARQWLAQVLLRGDRPADAEAAFREDLAVYPDNAVSTKGLAHAAEARSAAGDLATR